MAELAERKERERLKRLNRLAASSASVSRKDPQERRDQKNSPGPRKEHSTSPVRKSVLAERKVVSSDDQTLPQQSAQDNKRDTDSNHIESLDSWTAKTISSTLQITLDPTYERLYYLSQMHEELSAELSDKNVVPELTLDILDRAILARISDDLDESPFDYLLRCYQRTDAIYRKLKREVNHEPKLQVLNEIRRLCVSYAALSVTLPEILGSMHTPPDIVARLLHEDQDSDGLPDQFITDLVTKLTEEDMLETFFGPLLTGLSRSLAALTLNENFYRHFSALRRLLQYPSIARTMTSHESFVPECSAPELETVSLLGPFFKISVINAKVAELTFATLVDGQSSQLSSAITSLRSTIPVLQGQLFDICNILIRHGMDTRTAVLNFFATVLRLNKKRHAIQVDAATVSSDGFMVNITAVLNRFAEPFMLDPMKISKIDIEYLRRQPLVDLDGETRLMADETTTHAYYAQQVSGDNNFISHVFFLNVAYHHYGLGATMSTHQKLMEKIRDMQKYKDRMQSQQPFTGPQGMMMTMQFQRIERALTQSKAISYCYEALLCDEASQARSFAFLSLVACWLIRLVDTGHSYPARMIELPLAPLDTAEAYSNLPEYFVEDIAEYFLYVSRMMPGLLSTTPTTDLVIFSLVFLRSSDYIKNPYLKAKLVEILFNGSRAARRGDTQGPLSPTLNAHALALEHLFPALMGFYIEVESTGLSSQFYDKFNIRFHISQIFKSIWENPAHRNKLALEAQNDLEFFVKFVALLLNDQTYLLDEALAKLSEIHTLQIELSAAEDVNTEQYQEKQGHLQQSERQATSYLQLGTETLSMLNLFTASIPAAFCTPEIADRLAAMLDYNIEALVGPKCTELKVQNPEKYNFDPKALLSAIVGIFLNMSQHTDFILAVVRDGRSYKKENFDRTCSILQKFSMRSSQDIEQLVDFVAKVEKRKTEYQQDEDDLGEVPDEYLDPLIGELMRDPVMLPTSKTIIDRGTIKRHLLNDATDPFNRAPLNLKDVIPAIELKAEIEAFIASKQRVKE